MMKSFIFKEQKKKCSEKEKSNTELFRLLPREALVMYIYIEILPELLRFLH